MMGYDQVLELPARTGFPPEGVIGQGRGRLGTSPYLEERGVSSVRTTITAVLVSSAVAAALTWSAASADENTDGDLVVPSHAVSTRYTSVRVDVATHVSYEQLVANFNAQVPQINLAAYRDLVARQAPWSEVVAEAERQAGPVGFVWFEQLNSCRVFALAPGFSAKCVVYTVGDPALAETMAVHDTRAVGYLPTKFLLYSDSDGRGHIVYVLPSSGIGALKPSLLGRAKEVDRRFRNLVDTISQ